MVPIQVVTPSLLCCKSKRLRELFFKSFLPTTLNFVWNLSWWVLAFHIGEENFSFKLYLKKKKCLKWCNKTLAKTIRDSVAIMGCFRCIISLQLTAAFVVEFKQTPVCCSRWSNPVILSNKSDDIFLASSALTSVKSLVNLILRCWPTTKTCGSKDKKNLSFTCKLSLLLSKCVWISAGNHSCVMSQRALTSLVETKSPVKCLTSLPCLFLRKKPSNKCPFFYQDAVNRGLNRRIFFFFWRMKWMMRSSAAERRSSASH